MVSLRPKHLGKVVQLDPRRRGSKKVSGLVQLDATNQVIPFSGIVQLTKKDLNTTKIFGRLVKGRNKGEERLTQVRRW